MISYISKLIDVRKSDLIVISELFKDYINNSIKQETKMIENLASLSLLNESKIGLLKERKRIVPTRIIIHPNIPQRHAQPIMYISIIVSLFLGLLIAISVVLIKNHNN